MGDGERIKNDRGTLKAYRQALKGDGKVTWRKMGHYTMIKRQKNVKLSLEPTVGQYRVLAGYVTQKTLEKRQRGLKVEKDLLMGDKEALKGNGEALKGYVVAFNGRQGDVKWQQETLKSDKETLKNTGNC